MTKPYESRGCVIPNDVTFRDALNETMIAVNGFYYAGDRSDAVISTIAWLRENPDVCSSLGLR